MAMRFLEIWDLWLLPFHLRWRVLSLLSPNWTSSSMGHLTHLTTVRFVNWRVLNLLRLMSVVPTPHAPPFKLTKLNRCPSPCHELSSETGILSPIDSENARLVTFALNASPSYISLYDDVFPESCVTQSLENFFSLECIGVSPTTSSYDDRYIEEFDSKVEFRNGNYFVVLPSPLLLTFETPTCQQVKR